MKFARLFACLLLLTGFLPKADAHQVPSVELEFLKMDDQWRLEGEMDIAYMLPETRNIPGGPPLSREAVMKSPPEEMARIRKETENTLRKLIRITFADKDVPWRVEFPDFKKDPFQLPPEIGDVALLTTRLIVDPIVRAGELRIHWAGEQETELIISTEEESEDGGIFSTLPGGSLMLLKQADTGKPMEVEKPITGGWVQLGFHHVMGWDHILFILGLFLLSPKWKSLVRQSLLFTLAHSITLALAVLGLVTAPEMWVEHLIALSIAWVGIENLLIRKLNMQRMIFVFCFGLLHGLGYASILTAKLSGIPRNQLVGPLLGFNVGVELAQIMILVLAFALLWPIRKWTLQVQIIGSVIVAVAGIAWAIQRIFFPGSALF
ncbi:MAG: HupE/UreJ family protein [Luteolibacter sp.]|uniref:HupE/UreJ family protein n=1 Tax=Luteolibacter sp. TaxID=1962973 RepID=UPI0032635D10